MKGELLVGMAHVAGLRGGEVKVPVHLDREWITRHQLIVAATGMGKSGLLLSEWMALQNPDLPRVSTALFAVEGNEVRALDHSSAKRAVILDCANTFSYNPLAPVPGISAEAAADDLVRALSIMFLGVAGMSLLKPIVKRLMEEHLRGTPRTMADLRVAVRGTKHRARDQVLNKLDVVDANMFRSSKALDVEKLCRLHVVYLVEGVDSHVIAFFFQDLLAKTMRWKRVVEQAHFKDPGEVQLVVFLVDEAQRLFNVAAAMSPQDLVFVPSIMAAGQSRKLGLGLILATQQINLIPESFVANCGVVLAGRVGDTASLQTLRSILGLDERQFAYYRGLMAKRTFLLRKAGAALPFPVTSPEIRMGRTALSAEAITKWNREVGEAIPAAAELLRNYAGPREDAGGDGAGIRGSEDRGVAAGREGAARSEGKPAGGGTGSVPVEKGSLRSRDLLYAEAIVRQNFNTTCEVFTHLRGVLSQQDANACRRRMLEKGELAVERIANGGKGTICSLVLTPIGLGAYGLQAPPPCGRGSYEHQWLCFRMAEYWRAHGRVVGLEHELGSSGGGGRRRYVDLWIEPEGWAIQLSLRNQKGKEIEAVIDLMGVAEVRRILLVANNRPHLQALEQDLRRQLSEAGVVDPGNRLTFHLAKEFLSAAGG
jgi:hypothetical protein